MKLEVGMYVRTKKGRIGKLMGHMAFDENKIAIWTNTTEKGIKITPIIDKNTIVKASYNIMDLIEVGDYINGMKVTKICFDKDGEKILTVSCYLELVNKDIKSIVTKEQFESMKYSLEG